MKGLLLQAFLALAFVSSSVVFAADSKPVVGPGATKEEIINAYGWPNGQSQSGTKEILNYPQGKVTLENGRAEKIDFNPKIPWPPPRPRPGPPTASTAKKPEAVIDFWYTNFDQAAKEAMRRNARILALFIGSDWSPPSKQFLDEVAYHGDFVNLFTGDFVFLKLDFPTRTPMSREQHDQNNALRERYGVTVYPTLLVLSPAGTVVGQVDLAKSYDGDTYRARIIAAVREVRDLLIAHPPPPDPVAGQPAVVPVAESKPAGDTALLASLTSARWLVIAGIGFGGFLIAACFWWMWRRSAPKEQTVARVSMMAARISDAAGGLPKAADLRAWPREKLCAVTAGLAESDGYEAQVYPTGQDKQIVLKRPGETQARVLVYCASAPQGPVPAKKVREFFATLTAEGVETGWYVCPTGFAPDARSFAEQHNIALIDGDRLMDQLRDLPPLVLPKVLTRQA